MKRLESIFKSLNDDDLLVAVKVMDALYGDVIEWWNDRINERVNHAYISIRKENVDESIR